MPRLLAFVSASALLLALGASTPGKFAKYKAVEAYEVRPGILAMPRYTQDGKVCEIDLEASHFSSGLFQLRPEMTGQEIQQIAEELAPLSERGPRPQSILLQSGISLLGLVSDESENYEDISIHIYRNIDSAEGSEGVRLSSDEPATITWNHRVCRK